MPSITDIFKNEYDPAMAWSERAINGHRLELIKNIRALLILLSGNDLTQMLKDIIKNEELKVIANKYYAGLTNLSIPINKVKSKNKHVFFNKLKGCFTLKELKDMNYQVSKKLWSSCKRNNNRSLGGRPSLANDKITKINEILRQNSNISSYRTIKLYKRPSSERFSKFEPRKKRKKISETVELKKTENVQFLNISIKEALSKYNKTYVNDKDENKISKTSFHKYLKEAQVFKKPHNFTDLCPYCETGRKIKDEVRHFTKENTTFNGEFDTESLTNFYSELNYPEIIIKLDHLSEIEFHKSIADRQRKVYYKYMKDPEFLGENSILIDVDWKEKIYYGKKSPRQTKEEWFKYGSCSLLGFGIYYLSYKTNLNTNQIEKSVKCLHIDILCEDTSQKAIDYIKKFRFLRTLPEFQNIEKKNYIIFSDTGSSFRCEEICHFYLVELAKSDIRVSFNYFGEYHGKNMRDQHFSIVNNYINQIENLNRITNVYQLCEGLNYYQDKTNSNKPTDDKINYLAIIMPTIKEQISIKKLKIVQISALYNIQNVTVDDEFRIYTSIFTDLINILSLDATEDSSEQILQNELPVTQLQPFNCNINHLKNKRNNILRDIKNANKFIVSRDGNRIALELNDVVTEDNYLTPAESDCPSECFNRIKTNAHGKSCNKLCNYSINELKNLTTPFLLDELENHNHPKSLIKYKKKSKIVFFSNDERKIELINHYKVFHGKQ